MFLEVDDATIGPTELANMLDLHSDAKNVTFADTCLSLTKDPDCFTAGQRAWIEKWLEALKQ